MLFKSFCYVCWKKSFRVNLTLNRDKDDLDDSPDEAVDDYEEKKPISVAGINQSNIKVLPKPNKPPSRSRSVLGCDHQGIETLVSMLSSGGSDSEKEEPQLQKQDVPKSRPQMLRKTGN